MSKTRIVLLTSRKLYNQVDKMADTLLETMKDNDNFLDRELETLEKLIKVEEELIRAKKDNFRLSEENSNLKKQIDVLELALRYTESEES